MLEISITVIGIIQGILVMLNKRINWLVYALQMVLLVAFSYFNKLYGDMLQNAFYFFFCLFSWWMWKEGGVADKIKLLANKDRGYTLAFVVCTTLIIGWCLHNTDDPLPYTDAFTTVTTLVGLWLMGIRRVEAWVVWFFNDIAYMYQYFNLPNQALYLFGLYVVWTVMAVASFINWYRIYKNEKSIITIDNVTESIS